MSLACVKLVHKRTNKKKKESKNAYTRFLRSTTETMTSLIKKEENQRRLIQENRQNGVVIAF